MENSSKVKDLKELLLKQENSKKMRLFYNGREMHDHHALGQYGLSSNTVKKVSEGIGCDFVSLMIL